MSVKTALSLINRVWEEIENELDANFDPETQVALAWFATYGFETKPSGELTTLANAKNIPDKALFESGVFENLHGKAALTTARRRCRTDWSPGDRQHADSLGMRAAHRASAEGAEDGGEAAAARFVRRWARRPRTRGNSPIAYIEIATQKGWSRGGARLQRTCAGMGEARRHRASTATSREDQAEAQASLQF